MGTVWRSVYEVVSRTGNNDNNNNTCIRDGMRWRLFRRTWADCLTLCGIVLAWSGIVLHCLAFAVPHPVLAWSAKACLGQWGLAMWPQERPALRRALADIYRASNFILLFPSLDGDGNGNARGGYGTGGGMTLPCSWRFHSLQI